MAKKIVITKDTMLGEAWLHKSQDVPTKEEIAEDNRKAAERRKTTETK